METFSNKIAEIFLKKFNLKKGDCVALFMENKPEYVGIVLGLSKIGVISSLINVNLKNQQLAHSINVALPKIVIYGNELAKSKLRNFRIEFYHIFSILNEIKKKQRY
jgi:acyl-coenzyme A synthetase/AMP-(fatty) acid ligase